MWACVMTMAFTVSPCFLTTSRMRAISSPGPPRAPPGCLHRRIPSSCIATFPPGGFRGSYADCILYGMGDVLGVIMQVAALVSSLTTLIGGILYGRPVMVPVSATLAKGRARSAGRSGRRGFSSIGSGRHLRVNRLGGVQHPQHSRPTGRSIRPLLGIKLLLALHVFAVALLIARPGNPRRTG